MFASKGLYIDLGPGLFIFSFLAGHYSYMPMSYINYLTIRLRARDFYVEIVDEGEAQINYPRIEIESIKIVLIESPIRN